MLPRHDDAVVGKRLDLQAGRDNEGLLEFAFFLAETEIELVSRGLVDGHRAELAAESAHGRQSVEERLDRRFIIAGIETPLRRLHGGRHACQSFCEIFWRPRAGEPRETGQTGVDAVEERRLVLLHLPGKRRLDQLVRGLRRGRRQREELAHALTLVHAPRFGPDFRIGLSEQPVVDARVDARDAAGGLRLSGKAEPGAVIQLHRLPRTQAVLDLPGIFRRIAGELVCVARDDGRRHMMLASRIASGWQRGDHIRTNHPDQPDVVVRNLVATPLLERLFDAERVAEVDGPREVLLRAVEPMQGAELLRAQHAERLENLRSNLVLAAVAARRGRERRAIAVPVIEHHQQPIVLVVGVRGRVHEDAGIRQMTQGEAERNVSLHVVEWHDAHLRARKR